jgi:hypothetical protein
MCSESAKLLSCFCHLEHTGREHGIYGQQHPGLTVIEDWPGMHESLPLGYEMNLKMSLENSTWPGLSSGLCSGSELHLNSHISSEALASQAARPGHLRVGLLLTLTAVLKILKQLAYHTWGGSVELISRWEPIGWGKGGTENVSMERKMFGSCVPANVLE